MFKQLAKWTGIMGSKLIWITAKLDTGMFFEALSTYFTQNSAAPRCILPLKADKKKFG